MIKSIKEAQDRFLSKKWGIFNHFLYGIQNNPSLPNSYGKVTDWDTLVNEFDTDLLAKQLHDIGASYYVITVMQGNAYLIAPNKTFDKIANTKPGEACATRDLIDDLYKSLSKYSIDLFLYFTGDGPYKNEKIGTKFGFIEPREKGVNKDFVTRWAGVLKEYALRYKDKISGWWIDGCYRDYFKYTDELLKIYYDACKIGNKAALVSLNNGVNCDDLAVNSSFEDFTCGECIDFNVIPKKRFYGNAQAHILTWLGTGDSGIGPGWGSFGSRCNAKELKAYIDKVNDAGAVVTIDIGVYRDGRFDKNQLETFKFLKSKTNN